MAPGRKVGSGKRQPAEQELTDYEKERTLNIMRNNQRIQELGMLKLKSILSQTAAPLNTKERGTAGTNNNKKARGTAVSDSLYQPEENDDSEEEGVEKSSNDTTRMPFGGARTKRVMAPGGQGLPARVTRQKTRASASTHEDLPATDVALVPPRSPAQHEDPLLMDDEVEHTTITEQVHRGRTLGKGLERISRGLGTKLAIHISEGNKRPETPMQAAKLASEGGIVLRQHIPILPHWKEYKKDPSILTDYIGKVAVQFTMDTNSKPVKDACVDMLKGGQRQMRHRLKKQYFDDVPANQVRTTSPVNSMTDEQWRALVAMWSSPRHKEKCQKYKLNREFVKLQQRTGSRCYIAHRFAVTEMLYPDAPPNAIELFKECHLSKKKGLAEPVQKAIDDMNAIMAAPVEDEQQPNIAIEAVSQVLPSSKFLQNVGLQPALKKRSSRAETLRVQELEAQLEKEKQDKEELRQKLDGQQQEIDNLKKQSEEARQKHLEDVGDLKKQLEENNALLRGLISFNQSQ
ncbi:hypothetical protein PVAP13_7KG136855 [Panicum virgatum]|uniref:Uncharacterized protein n=1 Tax=Panicum virgatum TaxID=38727 RepID=A0A8T0QMU3_PANVG|nr:hypothetical protein PVAP13_7KG136855 [Panicum virgatum]